MTRRAVAAIAAAVAIASGLATTAQAAQPMRFRVSFGDGARLGRETSVRLSLRLDPLLTPATSVRILLPPGIDPALSRLGAASCKRPSAEIAGVLHGVLREPPCPANALLGTGSATARLMLEHDEGVPGAARIALYAGDTIADKAGLIVVADAYNPMRTQLTYAGYLYVPPDPFGLGLAILIPPIPKPPFGAALALSAMSLVAGAPAITYTHRVHGRRVRYRPGGLPLPARCPRALHFRFRAIVRFTDGTRRAQDALVRCPRSRSHRR